MNARAISDASGFPDARSQSTYFYFRHPGASLKGADSGVHLHFTGMTERFLLLHSPKCGLKEHFFLC
jgi:hypothetical protein